MGNEEYKQKEGSGFLGVIAVMLMAAFIMFIILWPEITKPKVVSFKYYTIQPGDTIWSIADEENGEVNIERYVYKIREHNRIEKYIQPGDRILLPIFEN